VTLYDEQFDTRGVPDRVFYEAGVLLDADDLRAEQSYHRGRLTRILNYLHGAGTAAGLRVTYAAENDEVRVSPGIAVDRVGRLIEIPRPACVRIGRWLQHQGEMLANPDAFEGESAVLQALSADQSAVVADVFVRFAVCSRGRTPAFATGPFDALDATVPHRLRDSYELFIALRGGDSAPLPVNPWPQRQAGEALPDWEGRLREAILDGWRHGTEDWQDGRPLPDASTIGVEDSTSVFLARLRVPVLISTSTGIPERQVDGGGLPSPVIVQDQARPIVYSTASLMRWFEALALPAV
jgi:hypothetical protein